MSNPLKSSSKSKHNLDTGRKSKSGSEPLSSDIMEAEKMLEDLKRRKEEQAAAEARRIQIEERKEAFVEFHNEVMEKLKGALPTIETEVKQRRNEVEDLEKARTHFSATLKKLQTYDPEGWSEKDVMDRSDSYEEALEKASKEYDQFVDYIGKGKKAKRVSVASVPSMNFPPFATDFLRGLAFSLPLIIALVVLCVVFGG